MLIEYFSGLGIEDLGLGPKPSSLEGLGGLVLNGCNRFGRG